MGESDNGLTPTYVYPQDLREAIRRRFSDTPSSGHDDKYEVTGYKVSWAELMQVKWPQSPKSCTLCRHKDSKPY